MMNTVPSTDGGGGRLAPDVECIAAWIEGAELLQRAGRLGDARLQFATALEAARDVDDPELFARAALGLGGVWVHEHRNTVDRVHALAFQREAAARLPADSPLATRLRLRVMAETSYARGDPAPMLDELANARAVDDAITLAEALSLAHHCMLGPDYRRERAKLASEMITVSALTGRALDASMGLMWQTIDYFLAGDPRADRSLEQLRAREVEDCVRYVVLALGVMQAARAGDMDRAELLAGECYEFGLEVGDPDALGWYGAQIVLLRWLQGRAEELLPYLSELCESPTLAEDNDVFDAGIAAIAAEAGRADEARAALRRLRTRGFGAGRNSSAWLVKLQGIIEAARHLDDGATAREAYDLLSPYSGLPAMASLAVACFGSVDRALGVAAATFGDADLAVAHLERAIETDLALGNRPAYAMSSAALADTLSSTSRADDRERAARVRRTAVDVARACGMDRRAESWTSESDDDRDAECRREGRMWHVRVSGRTVVVPDSVGMRYLARLMESPGQEIAAVELAGHQPEPSARQAVVDERAIASYRRRAGELQAEIDEADDHHDLERAARARAEFDALVDEVKRTTGLLGRTRAFVDPAERARTSVQKAIKRALERIEGADAALGCELQDRVLTGMHCAFLPRL